MVGVFPALLGVLDSEVDEFTGRLLGWEMSTGFDRLADLPVQGLDRVGRVDNASDVGGEGEEGDHVLPGLAPALADHRVALAPARFEGRERLRGLVGARGGVDRLQLLGDPAAVLVGDEAERVANEVDVIPMSG